MNVEQPTKREALDRSGSGDSTFERPRLEPLDKPSGLMLRLIFWMAPRRYGKVPMPFRVIVTRAPKTLGLFNTLGKYEFKGVSLDKELHYLIPTFIAANNGCGFCLDYSRMMVWKASMNIEKFNALLEYETSQLFSERERAALRYAEEMTRNKRVSDETFAELRRHFTDTEIVEITTLTAIQNFENMLYISLGIGSDELCAIAQSRKK